MNIQEIIAVIDAELVRLEQVKSLLSGTRTTLSRKPGPPVIASLPDGIKTKRPVSSVARKKMAAAQKARWAKSRKTEKDGAPTAAAESTAKSVGSSAPVKTTQKRSTGAGARARIGAAQKTRWAKAHKAAKKTTSTNVGKKAGPARKTASAARRPTAKKTSASPASPVAPVAATS